MDTKQLQIVSFEQIQRLIKLGFGWEVSHHYNSFVGVPDDYDGSLPAPEISLVLKWFRDKHKLYGTVDMDNMLDGSGKFYYSTYDHNGKFIDAVNEVEWYDTYEEAENKLLDELITYSEPF